MAKLKTQDVIDIRNSFHLSNFEVSKRYGIVCGTVKQIRAGRTWDGVGGRHHFSKYKKDVLTGERHHACVVSDEIRAAIKSDTTTNTRDLARRYGLDKSLIPTIRGAQPQIRKARMIEDRIAQYVLDNPDLANSTLSKELSISVATISRIKTGKQFSHLKSMATEKQWESFYERQKKSLGFNF